MSRKKKVEAAEEWPPECCGVCHWWRAVHSDGHGSFGECYALPPAIINDGEGVIESRPTPEPNEPACSYFRPRHHA